MCGIAGFWTLGNDANADALRRMTDCLAHRGPDGAGYWIDRRGDVALGHRRLAIVDLSPTGEQPMRSASGRFVIVFNGEIYNFRALRQALEARGAIFRGSSDTEVMLAAFELDGVETAVKSFAGMFAFALWDSELRQMWLGRDRLGEKPLYYALRTGVCLFGSELKALTAHPGCSRELDPIAIGCVLRYGYVPAPRSIYRDVHKLHPGELLRLSEDASASLSARSVRYWDAGEVAQRAVVTPRIASMEHAADSVEALLGTVICEQMLADVPVGAFLSGGIDSSLVVALMQRQSSTAVRTFTIAFEEAKFDESRFARSVSDVLGTTHTEIRLPATDALGVLDRLPTVFDEPFADSSQLPTWLVSQVTRQHVTVALSGDGGDELFGGYSQHTGRDAIRDGIRRVPSFARPALGQMLAAAPRSVVESALRLLGGGGHTVATRDRLLRGLKSGDSAVLYEDRQAIWIRPQSVLRPEWANKLPMMLQQDALWIDSTSHAEQLMAYDAQTYLSGDILVKVDRAAMANSLETRAPLLDYRMYELAWSLPTAVKIEDGVGKLVLRKVLERYVPLSLFDRPKQGFAIPIARWLRSELRPWAEALLNYAEQPASPIDGRALRVVWELHLTGNQDRSSQLWSAFVLLQWLRDYHFA